MVRALNGLGETAYILGDHQASCQYFAEALETAFENKLFPFTLASLFGLTRHMMEKHQLETAVMVLTFICNITVADQSIQVQAPTDVLLIGGRRVTVSDTMIAAQAKSWLVELESKLSPDAFASAQVQAQTLDFETIVKRALLR